MTKNKRLLKESIHHWNEVQRLCLCGDYKKADSITSTEECKLCQEYIWNTDDHHCVGCPVHSFTGKTGCSKTPFGTAARWLHYHCHPKNTPVKEFLLEAIKEELEFLKMLWRKEG